MKILNKKFSKVRLLIPLLLTHYLDLDNETKSYIMEYLDSWDKRLKHRGLADTLAYFKKVRLCFTKYLCDQPFAEMADVRLEDGIPSEILLLVRK